MQPIPPPEVLDPNRVMRSNKVDASTDDKEINDLLADALQQTCRYAQQLWRDLDAVRAYLLDSLPPDPRAPGLHPTASASPTGPDDQPGWDKWITAYASITSVLCGPQGDSGFGLGEAREAARRRRTAPVLQVYGEHLEPRAAAEQTPAPVSSRVHALRADRTRVARAAAAAIVVLLAARGLRPHRRGM